MKNFTKQSENVSSSIPFSSTNDKKFQPQLNTRVIKLYDFYEIYSLEADRSVTNITSNLYIYKASGKIKEGYDHLKGSPEEYSGFLGIINVLGANFLVLVKEVNVLFSLEGKDKIFEVVSIEFKEISENPEQTKLSKEVIGFLERIEKILSSGGYYFSYRYPITLSQQKISDLQAQQQKVGTNQPPSSSLSLVDYDYMWNYNLMKPLMQQRISTDWQTQLIQGHVFNIITYMPNLTYYTVISRRSMRRGGTRYSHRGINSDGFVANFVETEQMLVIPSADCVVSHVQIRGSVPSFWSQKGLSAKIIIDSSKLLSNQACKLHLDYVVRNYQESTCVNLMSSSNTNEQKLTKEFTDQVRDGTNRRDLIEYQEFDFHHEVKGDRFDNIDIYIRVNILSNLQRYGFFIRNLKGDVMKKQKGIIRTNCLDCLDRTNFFQLRIAYNIITEVMFQQLNLRFKGQSETQQFQKDFQQCWGENGDNISMHYADTNATTSNVAKTGKQGFMGFLKGKFSSAKRFFKGNLTDAVKQQCYCIILGEHYETQENLGFQEDMQKELKLREEEFIKKNNIKIFACTWNINAYLPDKTTHLLNPIFRHNQKYDIVVVAFQELIELKPTNLMMSTHQKHNAQKYWQEIILNNIGSKDYFLVNTTNMVGIQTFIFAKNELNDRISDIEFGTIKCGFGGQLGNKGAVTVRFNVDDTSIAILNCHLPAGQSKTNDRLNTLQQCLQQAFQQEGMAAYKKEPLNKSDKLILIGDLNFRVDKKYADCIQVINKVINLQKEFKLKEAQTLIEEQILNYDQINCIRKLQQRQKSSSQMNIGLEQGQGQQGQGSMTYINDSSMSAMDKSACIKNFYEKPILFLPTYKFDNGTNNYDSSKKMRVPSYCDRILIWDIENDNTNIEQSYLLYESCLVDNSDHKPVCAVLQFQVKQINKEARDLIIEEILQIQGDKSKDALRESNNPRQYENDFDFISSKSDTIASTNHIEKKEISYIKKHHQDNLLQFTTQTTTNTTNFGTNGLKNAQGTTIIPNSTTMSNNYDGNSVWNFDFNSFNGSNSQNKTNYIQQTHTPDLLDDNYFNTPPNDNNQDELKGIIFNQVESVQQNQMTQKQQSQEQADLISQAPNLLTLESDKPNTPYSYQMQHHERNSLTNPQSHQQNHGVISSQPVNQHFNKDLYAQSSNHQNYINNSYPQQYQQQFTNSHHDNQQIYNFNIQQNSVNQQQQQQQHPINFGFPQGQQSQQQQYNYNYHNNQFK